MARALDEMAATEKTNFCALCSGPVLSEVNRPLTLCCWKCCSANSSTSRDSDPQPVLVSREQALFQYNCPAEALTQLQCRQKNRRLVKKKAHSPEKKSAAQKELGERDRKGAHGNGAVYFLVEVQTARKLWEDQLRQKERTRQRAQLEWRRQGPENVLGIKIRGMDPVLGHFLFRDYFTDRPKTTLHEIRRRFSVAGRVWQILQRCSGAHPEAAFDFCLKYPNAGPAEFAELKKNMRLVFKLEGLRILQRLSVHEIFQLKHTALKDVSQECFPGGVDPELYVLLYKRVGGRTAAQILEDPACRGRIAYPGSNAEVAEKLVTFWRERHDRFIRQARLDAALERAGLLAVVDRDLYESYVSGRVDLDVGEVLGHAAIKKSLIQALGEAEGMKHLSTGFEIYRRLHHQKVSSHASRVDSVVDDVKRRLSRGT